MSWSKSHFAFKNPTNLWRFRVIIFCFLIAIHSYFDFAHAALPDGCQRRIICELLMLLIAEIYCDLSMDETSREKP